MRLTKKENLFRKITTIQKRLDVRKQLERFDINMVTPLINNKLIKNYNFGFNKEMFASEEQDLFLKFVPYQYMTIFEIHGVSKFVKKLNK